MTLTKTLHLFYNAEIVNKAISLSETKHNLFDLFMLCEKLKSK